MEAQNVKAGDVIDQETIKHPWSQSTPASVYLQEALSVKSVLVYLLLFVKAKYISLSLFMASKQDYRCCVVPCPLTSRVGTHISYYVAVWEWSMPAVSSRGSWLWALREAVREERGRFAPAGRSLRTVRFAFPARVSLLPRRGDDSHFGVRKRIWQRRLWRALPFLSFHMPDLAISSSEELVSLVFCLKRKDYKTNKISRKRQIFEFCFFKRRFYLCCCTGGTIINNDNYSI